MLEIYGERSSPKGGAADITDRRTVLILCFDTPVNTSAQRKAYRVFVKKITSLGYIRIQKSVYAKLLKNGNSIQTEFKKFGEWAPSEAEIMIIPMSLAHFSNIVTIGEFNFDYDLFANPLLIV